VLRQPEGSWLRQAGQAVGLPWPSALEILAGALEIIGGVLLTLRVLLVPAATL